MIEQGLFLTLFLVINAGLPVTIIWAVAGSGLAIVAGMLAIRYMRERKRVQELLADQELKVLRARLDPHILQNTFEIMASRLDQQNTDAVIAFINQVSTYLRFVLDLSDKSIVTLEEELEFIEKYLELQKNMANGSLDYRVHVDDAVDTYGTDLPCMMLQPVVENAIKHGFRKMEGKRPFINITLEQQEQEIVCMVADNGCGLHEKSTSTQHISMGQHLTLKRLQLVYRKNKRRPSMQIITNASGGVTTIIKIPID